MTKQEAITELRLASHGSPDEFDGAIAKHEPIYVDEINDMIEEALNPNPFYIWN
jgi:hypothetical protein